MDRGRKKTLKGPLMPTLNAFRPGPIFTDVDDEIETLIELIESSEDEYGPGK